MNIVIRQVKEVFYYIKQYKKKSIITGLFQIIVWGLQAFLQILMIKTFDYAIKLESNFFLIYTLISIMVWGLYFFMNYVLSVYQGRLIIKLNTKLRRNIFKNLMVKNISDYYKKDSGEYLSKLTTNIKHIESFAWNPFFNGIGRVGQILWSIFFLAYLDISLIYLSIFTLIIMFFLPKFFEKNLEELGAKYSEILSNTTYKLKDILAGFSIFKYFNREQEFLYLGDKSSNLIEESSYKLEISKNKTGLIIAFINVIMQLLSDLVIMILVLKGRLSVSVLAGGCNLIAGVSNGFNELNQSRISISTCKKYLRETQLQKTKKENKKSNLQLNNKIDVRDLTFNFDDKKLFHKLNITFYIGKKHLIVGKSGVGKSTLLKLILGWYKNYEGEILFDGKNINNFSEEDINLKIGYIDQNVYLFNDTIKNNITLYERFNSSKIEKALIDSSMLEDIKQMPGGLDTLVGENGNKISGGQKQRVAIARALLYGKLVLFVDEGTSSLDEYNSKIIEEALLNNDSLTLVYIAHRISDENRNKFDYVIKL